MYSKFEALLKQRGTSAYKVSKETGVSQSTLSDWKRGISKPKEDKIRKIAEYFNKPISYFYDDQKKETPTVNSERERKVQRATELLQEYSEADLLWVIQMLEKMSPSKK